MNQDQNNLNQNNFNTQGNNGIPNNQQLQNNQNVNVNQTTFNSQQQANTDYQQITNQMYMQQPTPQPMNSFESENNSQNFNSKPPKKMNLGLIVGIVVIVAVVSIGIVFGNKLLSNDNNDNLNNNSDTNENIDSSEQTNTDRNNEQNDEYDNWAKVGMKNIYINYKNGKRKSEKTSSIIFNTNHTEIIALHYNKQDTFSGSTLDVFDFLNNGNVFQDIASSSEANFFGNSNSYKIVKKQSENLKINEIDTVKFIGSVTDENGRECYAYGYTFILDNTPCMVVGFILSENQEQSLIQNIKSEVDMMMKTVRTER